MLEYCVLGGACTRNSQCFGKSTAFCQERISVIIVFTNLEYLSRRAVIVPNLRIGALGRPTSVNAQKSFVGKILYLIRKLKAVFSRMEIKNDILLESFKSRRVIYDRFGRNNVRNSFARGAITRKICVYKN